ncbi:MAG: 16S rRNA (adenine(1518)-N(6)/adenine(1519)-N(6))-dimethyltransferase RsmA [Patescibacteria group bacterium]|nr:16S rRNA (adenine(1518)-N(6)/adenine(1519)-N(6))-dimethyltransferase RsmA [Patescibacteria group bacterium]
MRQKFGQHFLKNKIQLKKIADALELKENDAIIEIGSGHGELTFEIISTFKSLNINNFKIFAIEKDPLLAKRLRKKILNLKFTNAIEIIEGDAFKKIPIILESRIPLHENYKLVGNIPYYITGFLFRFLGELEPKPNIIVFTVQKEVAERIAAKPPKMNILSASICYWSLPKIIDFIPKKAFLPIPKVDSAIIKLDCIKNNASFLREKENYYRFIKLLFKQPRKTILNNVLGKNRNLSLIQKEQIIKKIDSISINPLARPHNLSIENIKNLSQILYN